MRITSFCIERVLLDPDADLPEQPRYHSIDNRWQPWLVPFAQQWFRPADDITALDFSDAQRAAIAAGRQRLWIFGYFTYLNAVEETLTHKFMARWDVRQGLVGERRPNYV